MAKGPNAFRTISEAADEVGVPQHVLRFWESKFTFITPVKRAGGRRFYRPQDVAVLKGVRHLLHDQGLTLKGVQKLHKAQGIRRLASYGDSDAASAFEGEPAPIAAVESAPSPPSAAGVDTAALRAVLTRIEAARGRLDAVLGR